MGLIGATKAQRLIAIRAWLFPPGLVSRRNDGNRDSTRRADIQSNLCQPMAKYEDDEGEFLDELCSCSCAWLANSQSGGGKSLHQVVSKAVLILLPETRACSE